MNKVIRRRAALRKDRARKLRRRVEHIDRAASRIRGRVEAAAKMTELSLQVLATCSETEARLAHAHPTGAERFQVVVDALAALMAGEIAGLRRGEGP